MPINQDLPDLAELGDEYVERFNAIYKRAAAAYKALPEEERKGKRNPVLGRGDIRLGFALALANGVTLAGTTPAPAAPTAPAQAAPPPETALANGHVHFGEVYVAGCPGCEALNLPAGQVPEPTPVPVATTPPGGDDSVPSGVAVEVEQAPAAESTTEPVTGRELVEEDRAQEPVVRTPKACDTCGTMMVSVTEHRKATATRDARDVTYLRCPNRKNHDKDQGGNAKADAA
jgi:hypothetical protein